MHTISHQTLWQNNHRGRYRTDMSQTLKAAWSQARWQHIRPDTSLASPYTAEGFKILKQQHIKPYAYSSRIIELILQDLQQDEYGIAYFSPEGILMKLFGSSSFLEWAGQHGLCRNTAWSFDIAGPNAVSLGFQSLTETMTIASDNYNQLLNQLAIYFHPLFLKKQENSIQDICLYGGLALISKTPVANKTYMSLIRSLTLDIEVHMHMTHTLYSVYSKTERGMICFDISQLTHTISISYYNKEIFDVLGIPEENLDFFRIENIFDYGMNEELYTIIQNSRIVNNYPITLCVHGKFREYTISTEIYNQAHLRITGIRVYITSSQFNAQQISKKMGSNAIMTIHDLIGESPSFHLTKAHVKLCAKTSTNVLLLGESGVGKDIIAQAIHNASPRRNKPFIAVNCAALPRDLIAAELFGYDEGAYTGSKRGGNMGKFELANGGTIFLDEIGDMPLDLQAMLLRVIEQKSFMRIGSNKLTHVDVKVISATNADLQSLIEQNKFRMDLYYRLGIVKLNIPPLRERGEDIILLAQHFIKKVDESTHYNLHNHTTLSPDAQKLLMSLPWKGNVRELQNTIEGIMLLYQPTILTSEHIKSYLGLSTRTNVPPLQFAADLNESAANTAVPYSRIAPKDLTADYLISILKQNKYNKSLTAAALGISRKSLYRKMKDFGIE